MPNSSNYFKRLLIGIAAVVIVICAWYPPIQDLANAQVDAGFKRALISFASARTLNAGISVLQGTEFSMQPLGVGVTLTLGQVLDPINDLIEQFSSLMLMATVMFGVQKALMLIGGHWVVSIMASGLTFAWAVLHTRRKAPAWLSRLVLVTLMIRFAIPIMTLGSGFLFQQLMDSDYQKQQASLDIAAAEIGRASPQISPSGGDKGWWENLKEKAGANLPTFNYETIKKYVQDLPERIIKLIVIFTLQTVVLPALLLWAMYTAAFGFIRPATAVS